MFRQLSIFYVALLGIFLIVVQAQARRSAMDEYTFQNSAGSRKYFVYAPSNLDTSKKSPLVVMLHGCTQTASEFADGIGMNALADKEGFVVVYPQQDRTDNPSRCWNWFLPENQRRDSGELSILTGIIDEVITNAKIDARRIYVAGISAGGAMSSNLAACYSDKIAGVAVHSGPPYMAADSQFAALQAMRTGPSKTVNVIAEGAIECTGKTRAKPMPTLNIQGDADYVVWDINSTAVIQSFAIMNDLADDGEKNSSQSVDLLSSSDEQVPGGRAYKVENYGSKDFPIQHVMVKGMGHAWSGAVKEGAYADTKAPSASAMIWDLLSKHHR